MDPVLSMLLLYAVGMALLVADIFIPSHGILLVVGLGCLGYGIHEAFQISEPIGYVSIVSIPVAVATLIVYSIRIWHRTPVGRRISPPNPVLTEEDTGPRQDLLAPLLGQIGTSLTPLRPVGQCQFGNRKVECVAESGMIERGAAVRAVGIRNMSLEVRRCADADPR